MSREKRYVTRTQDGQHEAELVARVGWFRYRAELYVDGELAETQSGFLDRESLRAVSRSHRRPENATSVRLKGRGFVADVGFFPQRLHGYLRTASGQPLDEHLEDERAAGEDQ